MRAPATIVGSTQWPGTRQHAAAAHDAAAGRDGLGERALERGDRGGVDQRTHQRVGCERIADAHLRVRVHEPPLELGGARLVHDEAARRRAALPRRADGAEQHGRHDEVEVGVLGDDERVVARALEQHAAEAAGHARRDVAADGRRPGERHERDARIVDDARRACALSVTASVKIGGSASSSTTRLASACTASAVSGVFGDGFQTTALPQTAASVAFHAQTATGKLKAVTTPTTPSGCHCSYIRCATRSECIVLP